MSRVVPFPRRGWRLSGSALLPEKIRARAVANARVLSNAMSRDTRSPGGAFWGGSRSVQSPWGGNGRFHKIPREKRLKLANYHQLECPYDNWVILLLGDFSAPGKHPSGGFTRADGQVRDRGQPEARAPIHERVHADALVWVSNMAAISNLPNGRGISRHWHVIHAFARD